MEAQARSALQLLAELRDKRRAWNEARLLVVRRKLKLAAAHETLIVAQTAEQDLNRAVELAEMALLQQVAAEVEQTEVEGVGAGGWQVTGHGNERASGHLIGL